MTKKQIDSSFEEHGIKKLSATSHHRIRTEMYLGSRSIVETNTVLFNDKGFELKTLNFVPSLMVAFREIFDNCIDAGIKNKVKDLTVRVDYDPANLSFTIQDNSGGMPIDYSHTEGKNLAELLVSNTMMGSNFNDEERAGAGVNGLGGSVVCSVSKNYNIEIIRSGKPFPEDDGYTGNYKYVQNFSEPTELFPELQIEPPKITKVKSDKCGTTVKFQLSKEVFKNRELPEELIYSIIHEVAACNIDYKFYFNGTRVSYTGTVEKNLFKKAKPITLEVKDESISLISTFYVLPNAFPGENMITSGLVNNIPSIGGNGSQFDTFKKGFALGVISALEKESRKRKLKPNRSDVESGLFLYNNTKMNAPYFNSQMKAVLINEEIIKPITSAMSPEWFNDVVKKNKDWVEEIYTRCAERTNKKDAEEDRKAAKKLVKGKVAKLRPATGTNRSECTLLLAEGDSAISAILAARNSKIHGVLPLRGKIMNVSGQEKTKELMESMPLHDIMVSMNLVPGFPLERDTLQYGKIYICADEDEDGKNIAALICNFLYKFWPEMFQDPENPILYVFKTPFIILEKGKETKYYYGHEVDNYNPDDWKGWKATRAKGLGTLEVNNFQDAMYNGYVVPIIDDGNMGTTLDLIFNKGRADDRKEWMKD